MDCRHCAVRIRTEWFGLDATQVNCLNAAKTSRTYAAGETIFRQGDPCGGLYYVASGLAGRVRRFRTEGTELLTFRHPGEPLELDVLLGHAVHSVDARAIRPSRICFIGRETFGRLIESSPASLLEFAKRLACHLDTAEENSTEQRVLDKRTRILRLLTALAMTAEPKPDSDTNRRVVELYLTPAEVAAALSMANRSVARILNVLAQQKVLQMQDQVIRITDVAGLRALALAGGGRRRRHRPDT